MATQLRTIGLTARVSSVECVVAFQVVHDAQDEGKLVHVHVEPLGVVDLRH